MREGMRDEKGGIRGFGWFEGAVMMRVRSPYETGTVLPSEGLAQIHDRDMSLGNRFSRQLQTMSFISALLPV